MITPIPYDPSYNALLRPYTRPPLPMSAEWFRHEDAIAAEFSRLAYFRFERGGDDALAVSNAVAAVGFGSPVWFWDRSAAGRRDQFDAQAFAAASRDVAIVAFRGTQSDSTDDLFTDAAATLTDWRGRGRVHWGFWGSLQTLLPDIEAWLRTVGARTVIITGHSLGAAMATLLAGLHPQSRLVNFGSPRVGDATFAASFDGRDVRRYVDCTDGVTIVPPDSPLYEHIGEERYIDKDGKVCAQPPTLQEIVRDQIEANVAYAKYARRFLVNPPLRSLADHAPINYVSAILGVRAGP